MTTQRTPVRQGILGDIGAIESGDPSAAHITVKSLKRLEAHGLSLLSQLNDLRNQAQFRLDATGTISVRKNSGAVDVGTEPRLNFIEGSGISFIVADSAPNAEVQITVAATGPILATTAPADVDLAAADIGVGTTAARSDHKHDLSEAIIPTWSGLHTFSAGMVSGNIASDTAVTPWLFTSNRLDAFAPTDAFEFKVAGDNTTIDTYHTKWTTSTGNVLMGVRLLDGYLEVPGILATNFSQLTVGGMTFGLISTEKILWWGGNGIGYNIPVVRDNGWSNYVSGANELRNIWWGNADQGTYPDPTFSQLTRFVATMHRALLKYGIYGGTVVP